MDTKPSSKMRERRRKLKTSFMPFKTNNKSIKLQSSAVYSRSVAPRKPRLSAPRKRVLSRKDLSINLPTSKLRQTRIKSSTLDTNSPELACLPWVPSSQTTTPWWLLRLYALYRYSCLGNFLLAFAVLVVYGWTVHSQKIWGESYRKLQKLQRNERQLMKTNEVLKNKLAQESEKANTGLSSPAANQTIFLPTKPWEQKQNSDENTKPTEPTSPSSLGY
ncbi:MAG: hypothetical protein HRU34_11565 [Richelia sp.]|nr:hypothetical protein [Richelia sp.]CDN14536.1 hypothetical protein RintRC_1362 [Richelia intracellularis]